MIKNVLVVGSGSAGLLAALGFVRTFPRVRVRIVRDPDIGIIGVGEGTTPALARFVLGYLGVPRKAFYDLAEPTWKLGIHFKWGTRGSFKFTFSRQLDNRFPNLPRPNGYYCENEFPGMDASSALMNHGKAFMRLPDGLPDISAAHAYHIENEKFVGLLERVAQASGVEIIDGKVIGAERGEEGVSKVHLQDGRNLEADFFIDASGFRGELIGKTLGGEFLSFRDTLFCDRAVVGGWQRSGEQILPYTTAEQMDSGWCWQIEHEHFINRGYVYCSDLISDEDAAAEFKRKNPKVPEQPRVVKFRSGAYRQTWIDNVVAIGNAAGFVEPLEASALELVCSHTHTLLEALSQCALEPTPSVRRLYNTSTHREWTNLRDFLGLHYKLNTSLDTPYWKLCREETNLSGLARLLEAYEENGPTGLCRYFLQSPNNAFGIEGHLCMLVGMKAPYRNHPEVTEQERGAWKRHLAEIDTHARQGLTVKEALEYVRHPGWQWHADQPVAAAR